MKRMKKSPFRRLFSLWIAVGMLLGILSGCSASEQSILVQVACLNTETEQAGTGALVMQNRRLPQMEGRELYLQLAQELTEHPENEQYSAVLHYEETLEDVIYDNQILTLVFSGALKSETESKQALILGALTQTYCALAEVEGIIVYAEAARLHEGVLTVSDFVMTADNLRVCDYDLLLYYPNANGTALETALCTVRLTADANLPLAVMETFLAGAVTAEGYVIDFIAEDTRIHSVSTYGTICTVNLSAEFLQENTANENGESLTVYAIVNSLTSLPGITGVQFLIDGEAVTSPYCDGFDKPLTAKGNI